MITDLHQAEASFIIQQAHLEEISTKTVLTPVKTRISPCIHFSDQIHHCLLEVGLLKFCDGQQIYESDKWFINKLKCQNLSLSKLYTRFCPTARAVIKSNSSWSKPSFEVQLLTKENLVLRNSSWSKPRAEEQNLVYNLLCMIIPEVSKRIRKP